MESFWNGFCGIFEDFLLFSATVLATRLVDFSFFSVQISRRVGSPLADSATEPLDALAFLPWPGGIREANK